MASVVDNWIDVIRGFHPLYSLTKAVRIASSSESNALTGRVGKLNANGEWEHGPGSGAEVPMILLPETSVSQTWMGDFFTSGLPQGVRHVLVGLAGYECQTTEFDETQTYAPNQLLSANTSGKLTNNVGGVAVAIHTHWVCGITSYANIGEGINFYVGQTGTEGQNVFRKNVLTFYTYFHPKV